MFNAKRLFGYLATGVMPEMTALDAAIEREEARRGVSDDLLDEMLAFLRGSVASSPTPLSSVRCPLSSTAQDAAPTSLDDHDAQYHPDGYKEGDSCKFRENRAKGDDADVGIEGQKIKDNGQRPRTKDKGRNTGLSNKKRKEYGDLMRRKHPEMDADKLLEELGKIGDRKLQGDAFRWAMKGAARLPEDLYKIEKARQMADRAKVDPLQYNTPQGCIDALTGKVEIKEKPIDPDMESELSDKKTFPMGVTTYEVQDDAQGQQKMREIINTHWGKDANPWCLLHGDGDGNLSDGSDGGYDAWHYWNHYNALPKRVAFKDGKLLAFMATDKGDPLAIGETISVEQDDIRVYTNLDPYKISSDYYFRGNEESSLDYDEWFKKNYPIEYEYIYDRKRDYLNKRLPKEQWWDRQDASHEGIPLGNMPVPGDKFGRWADFEIRDGEMKQIGGFAKRENGKKIIEWYANGNISQKNDGEVSLQYADDGNLVHYRDTRVDSPIEIAKWTSGGKLYQLLTKDGLTIDDEDIASNDPSIKKYLTEAERIYRENSQKREMTATDADPIGHHADGSPCYTQGCTRGGIPWANIQKHNAKERAQMKFDFDGKQSEKDRIAEYRQKLRRLGIDELGNELRATEDNPSSPEYKAVEAEINRRSGNYYDNLGERA